MERMGVPSLRLMTHSKLDLSQLDMSTSWRSFHRCC